MTHETLSYLAGQVRLDGQLYLPDAAENVPGIVIAPEWWGMTEHVKNAAAKLADAGYAALVLDLYGQGNTTDQAVQANAWMTALLENPVELMRRAKAGLEALAARPEVDEQRLAAIGFCFGGYVALHMARAGLPLKAVASFHGGVETATPAEKGKLQAALLVAHGDADSMVSMDDIAAFRAEMDAAAATYRIDIYPGARHAFTNPQADANAAKNGVDLGYDASAAAQSWEKMLAWLAQYLK
ncbi:MAG: dienelactone hydrolase family protein [Cardiobacteriaceae bacterium]|nr:dienelactone hydrolase family protein [Cardiobacteriaceae bacterium]